METRTVPLAVSAARAVAGAGIAVAGVALGIGALLWVTDAPSGSPTVVAVGADDPGGDPLAAEVPDDGVAVDAGGAAAGSAPGTATATRPSAVARSARPSAPAAAALPPVRQAPAAPAPRPALPSVTVLNNSTVDGLADRAAARFARAGWPVRLVGNFRGRLRATTVYYEPDQRTAALRFAGTFRGIPRVLPRPANIPGPRGLTVVLTRDFD